MKVQSTTIFQNTSMSQDSIHLSKLTLWFSETEIAVNHAVVIPNELCSVFYTLEMSLKVKSILVLS